MEDFHRRASTIAFAALLACPLVALVQPAAHAAEKTPGYVTAAMNDPARAADRANDDRRRMASVLTFSGVKPGSRVMELLPGSGYWTRAFSRIVGAHGHVYQIWASQTKPDNKSLMLWKPLATTEHYANVSVRRESLDRPPVPMPVDVVFTSQNYHDLHDPFLGPVPIAEFNKAVYGALKPGGVFVIVDHIAPAGSGTRDTDTLHRIDPASVRKEVEAAGFVFAGASDALLNPQDALNIPVFDLSIRGHTSQFIYRFYRFRKPAH